MDGLTFLRGDHESFLGMLEVLDGAPRGGGARVSGLGTMVENLIIAESRHEAIEEQLFWPAVREELDDGNKLADHAIAQEDAGKKLLQRLEEGEPGEPDFHEALAEFITAAREHISYEQDVVWPRFAAAVGPEELEKLGEKLEQASKIAPTRPHPHTPSGPGVQKTVGAAAAVADHVRDAASGRSEHRPPRSPNP